MRFSNSNLQRDEILSRYFPNAALVASPEHTGLSGGSCVIANGEQRLVLRQQHAATTPAPFLRQYRALKRLPNSLAPRPQWLGQGWMAVEYLAGEVKTTLPHPHHLADLLYHLHQQPRFGWRITLLPLLERYWQGCDPARRTPRWLVWLKRLQREGEPGIIRLAPLHMDVHAGNLVHTASGLRLIDWEYAGDGDIALELASVWTVDERERERLISAYAQAANITYAQLAQQVRRWHPWVVMLMAGWYEYRWQQTGEPQFITLANETWCQLETKG